MHTVLVVVQVVVAVAVIGLILLQQGKGADAGAAFGSGASGSVFGSRGAANFLSRATAALATVFFIVSLSLAYLASGRTTAMGSVMDQQEAPVAAPMDAAPAPAVPEAIAPAAPADTSEAPKTPAVPE